MRRFAPALAPLFPLALGALPALAQTPPGYAFDRPQLLADQEVWGIAHGARLLALACARAGFGAAAEAWVDWQEREWAQIEAMRASLSRHYFGRDDAPPDAIAAALGLKSALALPAEELAPACQSLPKALAQPRYDLPRRREAVLARLRAAPEKKP